MIEGRISEGREAIVELDVMDAAGNPHSVEVALDTGFTGSLSLPTEVVHRLGLSSVGQRTFELASGDLFEFDVYLAVIRWHGRPTDTLVLKSDGAPFLGMTLLWGSRLMLEASHEGEVTIEEIEPLEGK